MRIEFAGKEPVLSEKYATEVPRRIIPTETDEEILDALHYLVRANGGKAVTLEQMTRGFDEAMKEQLLHRLKELGEHDKVHVSGMSWVSATYWPFQGSLLYALPRPPLLRWMRSKSGIHPSFPDLPNHILRFIGYEKRPTQGDDGRNEWWQLQVIIGARAGEVFWLPRICHSSLQVFPKLLSDPALNEDKPAP